MLLVQRVSWVAAYSTLKLETVLVSSGQFIVLGGIHAISVLACRDQGEQCNVDHILLELVKCSEANRYAVFVTCDPHFIFLGEEAGAMKNTDANVHDVVIGDGVFGKAGERHTSEELDNEELKAHGRMPICCHCCVIVLVVSG